MEKDKTKQEIREIAREIQREMTKNLSELDKGSWFTLINNFLAGTQPETSEGIAVPSSSGLKLDIKIVTMWN